MFTSHKQRNRFAKFVAWCIENNIEQSTQDILLGLADFVLGMTNQEIVSVFGKNALERLKTLDKPNADYIPEPRPNEEETKKHQN